MEQATENNKILKEMREIVSKCVDNQATYEEKLKSLDGIDREKFQKMSDALDSQEATNQKLIQEKKAAEAKETQLKERIDNLELVLSKSSKETLETKGYKHTDEFKALATLLIKDPSQEIPVEYEKHFKVDSTKYLRTDIGSQGGFMVPELTEAEMIREIIENSAVRPLVRVRTRRAKTLKLRKRTTIPTAYSEGEAIPAQESQRAVELEEFTSTRKTFFTEITRDEINFSDIDMISELQTDAAEAFAKQEGRDALLGDGIKQFQGILTDSAGVETFDTATSLKLSLSDLIRLRGELKQGYDELFAFSKRTWSELRLQTGDNGQFVWVMGAEGVPSTVFGVPYTIFQDMPEITSGGVGVAGAKGVLIGDFRRGYNILDSVGMEALRNDYSKQNQAMIQFTWFKWADGRVVLPEAFKILKIKA